MLSCLSIAALWLSAGLALLCVMFYCVFVTFPFGVLCQVWYLTVSIPDLCLLTYFHNWKIPTCDALEYIVCESEYEGFMKIQAYV